MTELSSGLQLGQRFNSLNEFKSAIRSISVRQHWELRVMRSNKKSVVFGCRSSSNCFFRVVCRTNKQATYITNLQDTHNCRRNSTGQGSTPVRSEASHVRFLLNEIPKLFDLNERIKAPDVVEAVKRYHGYDISIRQAQRALSRLQPRTRTEINTRSQEHSSSSQGPSQHVPVSAGLSANTTTTTHMDRLAAAQRWPENGISPLIEGDSIGQVNSLQVDATVQGMAAAGPAPASHSAQISGMPDHHHPHPHPHPPGIAEAARIAPTEAHHHPSPMNARHLQHQSLPLFAPSTEKQPMASANQQQQARLPQQRPTAEQQPPQQQTHPSQPGISQLVLTNFKIEFTCAACGALNQGFLPNHGHVTGNSYMTAPAPPGIGVQSQNARTAPSFSDTDRLNPRT